MTCRSFLSTILGTGLVGALAVTLGCGHHRIATAPPPTGIRFPATWQAEAVFTEADPGAWLEHFGDPLLSRLVRECWAHNHDLATAAARWRQARAQARIAGAARLPTLEARLSAVRRADRSESSRTGEETVFYNNVFEAGATLRWELDLWGGIAADSQAALAGADASAATWYWTRLSLAAEVARTYMLLAAADRQAAAADDDRATAASLLDLARQRLDRGLGSEAAVRNARTALIRAQTALGEYRRQRDAAARGLEYLLGRYPQATVAAGPLVLPGEERAIPAGIPAALLRRRPDLRAAAAHLLAAEYHLASAKADLLPRIDLTASGGYRSDELDDMLDPEQLVWNLLGNLVQPIFDRESRLTVAEQRQAAVDEALASYANSVLRALREVETALAAEAHLADAVADQATIVAETAAQATVARERFAAGLGDADAVLRAHRTHSTARQALIATRSERQRNRIALYLALGGDPGADPSDAGPTVPTVEEVRP